MVSVVWPRSTTDMSLLASFLLDGAIGWVGQNILKYMVAQDFLQISHFSHRLSLLKFETIHPRSKANMHTAKRSYGCAGRKYFLW